ncbi:hypothetical protein Tco_0211305, partial [Tanacetum coccineum]
WLIVYWNPLTPDTLIEFINELGYPREVINLSNVTTNDMFLPCRASQHSSICALRERTSGLKDQGPYVQDSLGCYRSKGIWHSSSRKKKRTIILIRREQTRGLWDDYNRMNSSMDVIRGAVYYVAYLKNPAKPTKQTKPKPTKQSKPTEPKAASKNPKPAPAKPQEKKRKPVSESLEAPPLAKRAKGKVVKKRTGTEEAILLKGNLILGNFNHARGAGKGEEKVGEDQGCSVLLHLQDYEEKEPTKQYIFQRHTPVPSEPAGHEESSSLYAELGLYGSDTESDEEMPSVVRSGAQDEGQAGPDPGTLDEGQAGPNPDDVAESQPLPIP